jgi:2Fe-2S ferredoxin
MSKVTFIEANGNRHVVDEAPAGRSLMQIALENLVPGILGDCGGTCNCGTCHAQVAPAWLDRLPPRSIDETLLLENADGYDEASSRLCCQLKMKDEWDGLELTVVGAGP